MNDHPDTTETASHVRRGRRPTLDAALAEKILQFISEGDSQRAAAIRAGIANCTWHAYKKKHPALHQRMALAKAQAAAKKYEAHKNLILAAREVRSQKRVNRSPKAQAWKQSKVVVWFLVYRVPLNLTTIPEQEIRAACGKVSLDWHRWLEQARDYSLMSRVYQRRAKLRAELLAGLATPNPAIC